MSDRGSPENESRRGPSTGLWVGALVLAAAATAVLILSDDARLLRLGLVAALWAALIGAFAVAKLRHRVAESEQLAAERQRVYELELEREIAARREFELEAEAEARRRAAEEADGELKALQAELRRLRDTLEQVVGGDVLFERIALRAESTRVRPIQPEGGKALDTQLVQHPAGPELPAANPAPATGLVVSRSSHEQPRDERRARPHPRPKSQQARPVPNRRPEKTPQDRPEPARRPQEPPVSGTPQAEPVAEPDPAGAHADGTSVNDLLAAYGGVTDKPRRRRRRT
ncbi:hypothetical protein GCM10011581_00530 [Saccharopolyspora subtropica]|uniref:DUF6779 domain-containing protein n=1 Tax=Saccharopolyspora thermophila TaxID=89367 RepID=A0A917N5R1_9PSEU|nr:DUF6779 domain-containing protein [Saccharopolyspora subtropica]GGI67603.1 hypothetical protein GCM10011581_00530 [Saccharopolyspora subtropica]